VSDKTKRDGINWLGGEREFKNPRFAKTFKFSLWRLLHSSVAVVVVAAANGVHMTTLDNVVNNWKGKNQLDWLVFRITVVIPIFCNKVMELATAWQETVVTFHFS